MAVNRRWRELVITSPLCWTHVDIGSNIYQNVMSSFLRSGPTQLVDVTIDFRAMMANGVSMEVACAATMKHHKQIRSLEVLNIPHWRQLAYFLEIWKRNRITTPNLKTISISSASRDLKPESITLNVFPQYDSHWPGAASVESLTLSSFNPFVLPSLKNLTFLELSTAGAPTNIFGHIFLASPLIETLVVHQYETDDFQDDSPNYSISAQSLRYLGVGSSRISLFDGPPRDDFSMLSAPNLEGMDILHCRWAARFQHPTKFPKLRRLRIHEFEYDSMDFLSSLPPRVTLEIAQMPSATIYVEHILKLANLERIVWTFEDRIYGFKVRSNFKMLWNMVRVIKEAVKSPTIMDVPPGEEPPSDVLAILGPKFTVCTSSGWQPWLLKHGSLHYGVDTNSESFSSS